MNVLQTSKERRTVETVKSVLTKLKNRLVKSGPVSLDEETALNQLEQLYVAKFLRLARENGCISAKEPLFNWIREEEDSLSCFAANRRDSDASVSNDTLISSTVSSVPNHHQAKQKHDYNGRHSWRRQWQRRRRLEQRRRIQPIPLHIDEEKGVCAARAVSSLYGQLLQQGRTALAAYDLLISTLRSVCAGDTWPGLVETRTGEFIRKCVLLSAEQIRDKYYNCGRNQADKEEQLNEAKLQVLLRLFTLAVNSDRQDDGSTEVVTILRLILSSLGDNTIVKQFLDEDVLESFLDSIPRKLADLYEQLDMSLPPELTSYASKGKKNSDDGTMERTPATKVKIARTPKVQPRTFVTKRRVERSVNGESAETTQTKSKKLKADSCGEKGSTATTTGASSRKSLVGEGDKQRQRANAKLSNINATSSREKLASDRHSGKVMAKSSSPSALLVSVRQSPRHHASTRALQSSSSSALSLLLQNGHLDGSSCNGYLENPVDGMEESLDESTRLVLVKAKRGYFLKNFLHEGENEEDEEDDEDANGGGKMARMESGMEKYKKKGKGGAIGNMDDAVETKLTKGAKILGKRGRKDRKSNGDVSMVTKECNSKLVNSGAPNKAGPSNRRQTMVKLEKLESKVALRSSKANHAKQEKGELGISKSNFAKGALERSKSNSTTKSGNSTKNEFRTSKNSSTKNIGTAKSSKWKPTDSGSSSAACSPSLSKYALPSYTVENYTKYVNEIRRERKRAGNEDQADLFYARGTRRCSIFYDSAAGVRSNRRRSATASECYSDEKMAPKNRSGRKMKSSVEVFHLANYLLNILNDNPSAPAVSKSLLQSLNTPIRLYRKLRLAPKNGRRRSMRQFCALKFNADEFKTIVDGSRGGDVRSSCSNGDEEGSGNGTDESGSVELNCGEFQPAKVETKQKDEGNIKMELTIDTRLEDDSTRRNSVSLCSGLSKTWNMMDADEKESESQNGYYLRRRRLFSDGHVDVSRSTIISPGANAMTMRRNEQQSAGMTCVLRSSKVTTSSSTDESDEFSLAPSSSHRFNQRASTGTVLKRLSSDASTDLPQFASSLLYSGLSPNNYRQVAADVH